MYSIALVCEVGASTGMVVRRMRAAAEALGLDAEVKAYPYSQLGLVLEAYDYVLLGPQVKFRLAQARKEYPEAADRLSVVDPVDFAMMNGERILKQAISVIDALNGAQEGKEG